MFDINTLTRNAAKDAYEKAGIGPEDLDMVELHDCFATAELLHYENLGLCGDGEAGKLIDDKETYNGGKIPVNASGGLLSKGHPLGATGVANIVEVVWHLREEAGAAAGARARRSGLAHVIGLGSRLHDQRPQEVAGSKSNRLERSATCRPLGLYRLDGFYSTY